MNRLQLAQRCKTECGIHGTTIASTTTATGNDAKIVAWVDTAWQRIQSSRNWDWLWEATTVTVLANTATTTGSIPASRYVKDGTRNPDGAELTFMDWRIFRRAYPSTFIVAGTPSAWTIRPDKAFAVNAKPASNTAFSVERYRNPTAMAANTDEPTGLPAEHHMLIVWRAVMLYAGSDEAAALYQHAQAEYRKVLAGMGLTDTPPIEWGAGW
jgi:hypothetical protein